MQLYVLRWSLAFGILCTAFWAQAISIMPRTIAELGFSYFHVAHRVPGRLLWLDEEGLKTDFPSLQYLSRRQLEAWILWNFSVVTDLQIALRGTIISDFHLAKGPPRLVYHPQGYVRAGVAEFQDPEHPERILGVMDLKGIGFSPEGRDQVEDFYGQFRKLTGEQPITEEDLKFSQARRETTERELAPLRAESVDHMTPQQQRNHLHVLDVDEKTLQIWTFLSHVFETCLREKRVATPNELAQYLEILGSRDYSNGSIGSSRLLKEILVQTQVARGTFATSTDSPSSNRLDTIHSYFLIELPIQVRTPSGVQHMGILGRQPHWRFQNFRDFPVPESVGVRDFLGRPQFSVFGQWVDFENVEVVGDPRFGLTHQGMQPVDAIAARATQGWGIFKRRKVERLFHGVFDGMPRPSPADPKIFPDEARKLEEFLSEVRTLRDDPQALMMKYLPLSRTDPSFFMVMQLLLVTQHPQWVAEFLTKLIEDPDPVEYRPAIFLEILLPLFQVNAHLAGQVLKKYYQVSSREERIPVIATLGFELIKREAFAKGLELPEFWMGYGSPAYMFTVLWLEESLDEQHKSKVQEVMDGLMSVSSGGSALNSTLREVLRILKGEKALAQVSSVQLRYHSISMKNFRVCVDP